MGGWAGGVNGEDDLEQVGQGVREVPVGQLVARLPTRSVAATHRPRLSPSRRALPSARRSGRSYDATATVLPGKRFCEDEPHSFGRTVVCMGDTRTIPADFPSGRVLNKSQGTLASIPAGSSVTGGVLPRQGLCRGDPCLVRLLGRASAPLSTDAIRSLFCCPVRPVLRIPVADIP